VEGGKGGGGGGEDISFVRMFLCRREDFAACSSNRAPAFAGSNITLNGNLPYFINTQISKYLLHFFVYFIVTFKT
jgi:hypothetical protein